MDETLKPSHVVAIFPFAINERATSRQADLCRGIACYFQRRLSQVPGVDARMQVMMTEDPESDSRGWLLPDAPFSVTQAQTFPFQPGFEPTHLLHGSFHWKRAVAHAEVVLIDMQSGIELIHEQGDGPLKEIYPRLVGLVGTVTAELVGSTSTGRLAARFPTKSTEAFERQLLGLAGLQAWNRGVAGPETAFHYFNSALTIDPNFREAAGELELLAEICLRAGDRDEKIAVNALEKAHRTLPDHYGLTSLLGFHLIDQENQDRGVELLRKAVEGDPFSRHGGRAMRTLAKHAHELGNLSEARRYLVRAVRTHPEDADSWEQLGNLHEEMGHHERAEDAWLRSLQEDPDRPRVLNSLGRSWAEKRRYQDAVPLLQRAVTMAPGFKESRMHLAECLIETGHPDQADELVTAWVEEQPDDVEGWLRLASVRRSLNQPDAAHYCLERASVLANTFEHHSRLAHETFALEHPDAHREWIRLEEEVGRIRGVGKNPLSLAVRRMNSILDEAPAIPPRYRRLAVRLYELSENWTAAARHQKELAPLHEEEPGFWDHLAKLQEKALDPTGAEESLRRSIALAPSDAERLLRLAILLKEMDRGPEALAVLTRASEAAPDRLSIKRLALQWREEESTPQRPRPTQPVPAPENREGTSLVRRALRMIRRGRD